MDFRGAQKDVHEWTGQFTPQYWPALEMMARLTEETGELAREMNHMYGTKKKKSSEQTKELGQELIDVIFTLCCIANSHNIDLTQEWANMMETKAYGRDSNRFTKKG